MLAAALAGCATSSVEIATIAPEDAQALLAPREKIHVLHKDRSYAPMIVTAVTDQEIIGEDSQVPLVDVESISLMAENAAWVQRQQKVLHGSRR